MSKGIIYTGSSANDGTGDSLRSGAAKINNNFTELYAALGDGSELLAADIDFGENKIYFKNSVATPADLNMFNGSKYQGMIVHVESNGSLYYGTNGTWRKLITDISDSLATSYVNPLSNVAYTGRLTDLGIDDGEADDVLTSNGDGTFSFKSIAAAQNTAALTLDGHGGAYYLDWGNFTNTPTTLQGYGITNAFSGNYNDLSNKPSLFSGAYADLTGRPTIPADLADLTDTTSLLFSRNYADLIGKPTIPTTIGDLGDVDLSGISSGKTLVWNGLTFIPQTPFSGSYTDLSNTPSFATVATSGSYADLTGTPTTFNGLTLTSTVSIGFVAGVGINEFSSDVTLSGDSNTAVPTEKAVKTYIDSAIAGFSAVGNFNFTGSTISTDDSSAILVTQGMQLYSDLDVGNNLTVSNDVFVTGAVHAGAFYSTGIGAPEITSESEITLSAVDRVTIAQSPLKMASFSTAERSNISAENGDIIYNTTTNKFQGYANGTWVDLH